MLLGREIFIFRVPFLTIFNDIITYYKCCRQHTKIQIGKVYIKWKLISPLGLSQLIEGGKWGDGKYYLVLSLHEGKDSSDLRMKYLVSKNINPVFGANNWYDTILSLGQSVITSLQKLHCLGYVHCDVKPTNILYDIIDNKYNFTLIDFGICEKFIDSNGQHVEKQLQESFNGSIEFIANDVLQKYSKLIAPFSIFKFGVQFQVIIYML